MMKKYHIFKTVQLIILLLTALLFAFLILFDRDLFHLIGANIQYRMVAVMLWIFVVQAFVFILLDFITLNSYQKKMSALDYAVHSDISTGIANRYSCDIFLEKYAEHALPPKFSCIMFDLSNISDINEQLGRSAGNEAIHAFSTILSNAAGGHGFVGHNAGCKYMAFFENDTDISKHFLENVSSGVTSYNAMNPPKALQYAFGQASSDEADIKSINDLVTTANKRITVQNI